MNEPERRKPLTGNSAEFLAAINRIHDDPNVRADIVTRAGTAFSSGGDVRNVQRQANGGVTHMEIRHEYRTGIQQLPLALFILEVPVIAAINGTAVGAGLDLACLCDIRLASDRAKFVESFVKLGIIPGDGGAWLLPRFVGMSRAAEMVFTGDIITAVNHKNVATPKQFTEALKGADLKQGVIIDFVRQGMKKFEVLKEGGN